jgi:hypothetical protein
MFFRHGPRDTRRIKDTCLLCAKAVYDNDPALDFLGLWMHRECFDAELSFREKDGPTPRAA